MTTIRRPRVNIQLVSADVDSANTPQKILVMGQGVGTSAAATLYENVTEQAYEALFAKRSQMAGMIRMIKRIAPEVQVDAIRIANGAGVPRQVTVAFTGNAAVNGQFRVIVGSGYDHVYTVDVTTGDTPTITAAALEALIDADDKCPFTAAVAVGTVTLTAFTTGLAANTYPVAVQGLVSGQTAVCTQSVAGTVDPTFTAALDPAMETRYQTILWPWAAKTVPGAWASARFNATDIIQDGIVFGYSQDTHANLLTEANALNNQSMVVLADLNRAGPGAHIGSSTPERGEVRAAQLAAIRAKRLTVGASISRYLTTSSSLDQRGGPALASLPLANTPLPFLPITPAGFGFTQLEIKQLRDAGFYVMGNNPAGTGTLSGEVVTTYKTDPAGNLDPTWKFLPYVDTASVAREYIDVNLRKRFAQSRLTLGGVTRGRSSTNDLVFRSYMLKLFGDLVSMQLAQEGPLALQFFKENLDIVIDLVVGKVTVDLRLPIVTQLREIDMVIKIAFGTGTTELADPAEE
ncbi:MAG TPA: hypothetical protein VMX57_08460 [Planctomycetota bacterium]|nr:hypothetical protein [Planctomycetota bacterium]